MAQTEGAESCFCPTPESKIEKMLQLVRAITILIPYTNYLSVKNMWRQLIETVKKNKNQWLPRVSGERVT